MAWQRHTSLTNFIIRQSRSFEGVCVPLRLTNCLFPAPDSQPTATELFQSPLYGSGTVFHSRSHLLRHLLSSALTWRHTSSNSVTRNYCCRAHEVTRSQVTLLRLTSRKPLLLYLQEFDIKSRWRYNWKSAQVVNSHLVCDPTIRQPGFDLPRQQWSLMNRFRREQGHCGACREKLRLTDTDLCPCGKTQTMSHIVESCPLTKLNGGLSRLHSADEDVVSWLTCYGSWNAHEKKKWNCQWKR